MPCPRCGSSDTESRRESDGNNYTYDHICRACDHSWWEPGGITLARAMSLDVSDPAPTRWVDGLADAPVTNRDYQRLAAQRGLPFEWSAPAEGIATVAWDDAAAYAAALGARLPTRHELARAAPAETTWTSDAPIDAERAAIRLARVAAHPAPVHDERGARLLEAIAADPAADAPRSVYADHLQQRGDPRGEHIALQLARGGGAPTERERELWSAHAPAWLGPLFAVLCPSATVVERGFLAAARVLPGPNVAAAIGDPRWATVVELVCDTADLIAHPCMRSLRRLSADPHVLAALASRPQPLAVESLIGTRRGIAFDTAYEAWTKIAKLGALPNVTAIAIETRYGAEDHIIKRLFATPLGKQLAAIDVTTTNFNYALDAWLPALRRGRALARVRCRLDEASVAILERRGADIELRVEGTPSAGMLRILGRLADAGLTPG